MNKTYRNVAKWFPTKTKRRMMLLVPIQQILIHCIIVMRKCTIFFYPCIYLKLITIIALPYNEQRANYPT